MWDAIPGYISAKWHFFHEAFQDLFGKSNLPLLRAPKHMSACLLEHYTLPINSPCSGIPSYSLGDRHLFYTWESPSV